MHTLVNNLIVFMILIIVGYVLARQARVSADFKNDISTLLLSVALPALMVNSMNQPYNPDLTRQGLMTALVVAVPIILGIGVGWLACRLFKVDKAQQGVLIVASGYSNMGFMGIPILNAIYGSEGIFLASFANFTFNLLFYTLAAAIMGTGKEGRKINLKEILLTPVMFGMLIGLLIYFLQPELPVFVTEGLDLIGGLTTPLAMIMVGLKLGEFPLAEMFRHKLNWLASAIRLLVMPLLTLLLLRLLPLEGQSIAAMVVLILTAMPIPGNSTLLAERYGGDTAFASQSTTLSTLLCLLTTPLFMYLGELLL